MRRTIPVLAATAGGLALLANFHTTPVATTVADGPPDPAPSTTATTAPQRGSGSPAMGPVTTTTTAPGGTRVIDGPVARNEYGDVQVRVTLDGTHIVDVQALQLPSHHSRSVRISNAAGPILRREALQAQKADIDLV